MVEFELSIICLAFFDECHQDCVTGDNPNGPLSDVQYQRNENGDYDPNGQYCITSHMPTSPTVLRCVPDEPRCTRVGCLMPVFDYSGKTLLSINIW